MARDERLGCGLGPAHPGILAFLAPLAADIAARAPKPPAGLVAARLRAGEVELATAGPVEEDAVFELGSITKAVTGLLLADAVLRGEVALDTPLGDCLPGARPLALGDLASHTSGLPRLPLAFVRRQGWRDLTDPYAGTTVEELLADLERVRLRRRRLRYSNFGAALLGQALASRADVLPHARGDALWWHNGGTHGSRAFTGFAPATGDAIAIVTNSAREPDALARRLLAR